MKNPIPGTGTGIPQGLGERWQSHWTGDCGGSHPEGIRNTVNNQGVEKHEIEHYTKSTLNLKSQFNYL